jgi:hypothetical protein
MKVHRIIFFAIGLTIASCVGNVGPAHVTPGNQPTSGPAAIQTTYLAPTPTSTTHIQDENHWSIYHPDDQHLWNRLFRQLYQRTTSDGKEYGWDSLDPLLWYETAYLLEGLSHQQAIQLLEEFISTRGEELIADPLKRAMFQRDLWAVFDWLSLRSDSYPSQRQALQERLARVIQLLALTGAEIRSLPNNYQEAIESNAFPISYRKEKPDAAFLPSDLLLPNGDWVCVGREGGPIADTHLREFPFFGRSAFLVFIRVPGGRELTLNYLSRLKWPSAPTIVPGTELALVRQMMLIDKQGNIIPSPIVESVQLRHFDSSNVQQFFELTLSRKLLFAGLRGGLRALDSSDMEFVLFRAHDYDPIERHPADIEHFRTAPLSQCVSCHHVEVQGITGAKSILSYSRLRFPLFEQIQPILIETIPELEAQAVIGWKLRHDTWQSMKQLWQAMTP